MRRQEGSILSQCKTHSRVGDVAVCECERRARRRPGARSVADQLERVACQQMWLELDLDGHHRPVGLEREIERLEHAHAEVLRTDRIGLISVRSDGQRLQVETGIWAAQNRSFYSPFGDSF